MNDTSSAIVVLFTICFKRKNFIQKKQTNNGWNENRNNNSIFD